MTDILESAKEQLHNNNFSIVIVGENDVYTSTKHGVAPLLEILDGGNDVIKNSFAADKVVGKAAALLMVKGGVKEVYADIISSHALDVFEKYKIKTYYGNLVEYIINRDKTGMCPMEKAVLEVYEPNTAYDVLKKKIAEMRKGVIDRLLLYNKYFVGRPLVAFLCGFVLQYGKCFVGATIGRP